MKHIIYMKYIQRYWKIALSVLFTIAVVLFWSLPAVSLMSFQEQYQLFLFTADYFFDRVSVPGGLVDYLAEFITQWNYIFVAGAILLALLFLVLQVLTWRLMKNLAAPSGWYPLSFVPAVLMLGDMSDANVMPSFLLALVFADASMLLWLRAARRFNVAVLSILVAVGLPVVYWVAGPVVIVLAAFILLGVVADKSRHLPLWLGAATVVYAVALIIVIASFRPEPLYRLFGGLNYYRYPAYIPWAQIGIMALVAIFPFAVRLLPACKSRLLLLVQFLAVFGGGCLLVVSCLNTVANELISYDYLVRMHAWDKIIAKAEKKQPSTPLEVSCVNFALSQKGQLCDRLFEFYQNGGEGLFPTFTRDMLSPVSTGEIFYTLGMVNDAERYFFEAQQAIPNYRRSGRLCQGIISCEIINGNYAVARKLLHELQHSLFYSGWAESRLAMLGNERKIDADPVYGRLRKFRVTKDYLFSDTEMDQMLGLVFTHCYSNRNAYEYLMAYELVQRDMAKFMKYYPVGRFAGYTDHIPYAIQQALLYDWTNRHSSFEGMPYSIEPQWQQLMAQFIQTYMANHEDPVLSEPPLCNTFWHYMLINKQKAKESENNSKEIY